MTTLITAERARELRDALAHAPGPWRCYYDEDAGTWLVESVPAGDAHAKYIVGEPTGNDGAIGAMLAAAPDLADTVIAQDSVIVRLMNEPADMKALREENAGLGVERDDLRDELAEAHALIARQRAILDGVANALKGDPAPAPGTMHDHSDLARLAGEWRRDCGSAVRLLSAAEHRYDAVTLPCGDGCNAGRGGCDRCGDTERVSALPEIARLQEDFTKEAERSDERLARALIAEKDNARLRATALTLYLGEHSNDVTGEEFNAAMAHGAELEAGR